MFVSVGFLCWFLVLQCQQLVTRRVAAADIWLLSQSRAVCMELPWVTHGRLIVACGRRCGVVALRVFTDYIGVLVMEGATRLECIVYSAKWLHSAFKACQCASHNTQCIFVIAFDEPSIDEHVI